MSNGINREFLVAMSDRAYELDGIIEANSGAPGSGKRAQLNALVAADERDVAPILNFFAAMPTVAERITFWNKVTKAIEAAYETEFDSFMDSLVPTAETTAKISGEELEKLIQERRDVGRNFTTLASVWSQIMPTDDISDIRVPKKMTGLRGSRGKRAISSYQFSLDGNKLAADENSLSYVAKKVEVAGEVWKARNLRDYCVDKAKELGQEFAWATPPESFSFTLPNGIVFSGSKMAEPVVDDSDEDGEDSPAA